MKSAAPQSVRISIATVFLAVGIPTLGGCFCPEPKAGATRTDELSEGMIAGHRDADGTLSDEACVRICEDFFSFTDVTGCVAEELGGGDTGDSGDTASGGVELTCTGTELSMCLGGRRPPGLRALPRRRAGADRSALHRMAWMEAASVHAFVRLHRELVLHGAPTELAARCLAAARDEVQHAHAVARMAGVPVPRPDVAALPLRDLGALALDNAVEGCVHETWAAVDAHLRATRGPHRATWARIAADETRHAQLAWDIDAWLAERGVARPDARRRAASRLVKAVAPSRRALATAMQERLWA